tara:strand:+ start:286 stop:570 length:285 start_codon:yes stop_codon:yes gene_type:complete
MSKSMQELLDAANDSIADFTWDHGDIIPQEIRELLREIQQQQDIAVKLEAEHALVRRQLELGPDDPLPPYTIEHGTVYDTSLAIQRSINRMKSF